MKLSTKDLKVHAALMAQNAAGHFPSVRSLEDKMQTLKFGAERWEGEVQGHVERLEEAGILRKLYKENEDYPPQHKGDKDQPVRLLGITPPEGQVPNADAVSTPIPPPEPA